MLSKAEEQMISAIREGDYRAFELLFSGYYSELCRFAKSYVHSDSVAEDLVSDLFVKIWEQPHLLAANTSLKGYLHRSIHNICINYITRSGSRLEDHDPETLKNLDNLIPSSDDPLMSTELETEIQKAISLLPAEYSKIFLMSRKFLLSHKEIAEQLKISENTVKVQIYRALTKLRDALREYL